MRNLDSEIFNDFVDGAENASAVGVWRTTITRADGGVEVGEQTNTLTSAGLNMLALLGTTNTNSSFRYLAVGTQSAASSLGSVAAGMGEVDRKLASTITTSNERMVLVATWAGAADSVTSVDLRTAAAFNGLSGGVALNFVNSVATVLADSDHLMLEMFVRIGSHNL